MTIKMLLKMVPKRVWIGLNVLYLTHLVMAGFAGAALYNWVF